MIRKPLYFTKYGASYVGDSIDLMSEIPNDSINLVVTSPPFALRRQKTYGNVSESEYVDWIKPFGKEIHRILKPNGSLVLDLGGAYRSGVPSRSLYNFRVLFAFCDEIGFHLAQDFYWFNPSKLPSPIEWVNKRKIRVKDAVNTIWWFSKTEFPKADVKNVLVPYSSRMKKLIEDPEKYYKPQKRPSGHNIGHSFGKDNGGAIPPNLLTIPNTDSSSTYLRLCKMFNLKRHPARFPVDLPKFFIKMLTDVGDTVLDIFSGSNTTGFVAETLERNWISFDSDFDFVRSSVFRFLENLSIDIVKQIFLNLENEEANYFITSPLHDSDTQIEIDFIS